MTDGQPEIPVLVSIAEIGASYKVWLVDIWGVMHDGLHAHRSAVEATKAFREQGGIVILLSNSPRPTTRNCKVGCEPACSGRRQNGLPTPIRCPTK